MRRRGRRERSAGELVGGLLLGILGGLALKALVDYLGRPRCPVCRRQIQRGVASCPYCHVALRWG